MQLTGQLEEKLGQLRLAGMQAHLSSRLKAAQDHALGYEDFLNTLLQDEGEHRKNLKIARLLRNASLRQQASLEGYDAKVHRGLDRKLVGDLATCRFILDSLKIIIMGPTGVGKTYLATALGNAACRHGYSTLFIRMNTLIEQTMLARAKGTYLNWLKKLAGIDLLILDDFGIKPLAPQQYQDLYDVLDERGDGKSTIVTSQLPVSNWNEIIPDPVTCEAVTDRLVSKSIKIQMKGESYRKKKAEVEAAALTKIDPS